MLSWRETLNALVGELESAIPKKLERKNSLTMNQKEHLYVLWSEFISESYQ